MSIFYTRRSPTRNKSILVIFIIGFIVGTFFPKEKILENTVYRDRKVEVIPAGYVSGETLRTEKDKSYQEGNTAGYNSGKTDGYKVGFSEGYAKCEEELTITIDKRRAESEKSNKNQVLFDVKR